MRRHRSFDSSTSRVRNGTLAAKASLPSTWVYTTVTLRHYTTRCPLLNRRLCSTVVQQRIGFLIPVGRDFWWSITPKTDLTALGKEVAATWVKYGKPWLEAKSTLEGAREHLLDQKHYFLVAMASYAMGKPDDARHWLDKTIEEWPEGKERVEAWRSAHLPPLTKGRRRTSG